MIDQHIVELQLLNSAAVVNDKPGSAALADQTKMTKEAEPVDEASLKDNLETLETLKKKLADGKLKKKHSRRGLSDVDLLNTSRIRRRPSDIDSLSPEVLKALQSAFGGKLDEVRSKRHTPLRPPSPLPESPSPARRPPPSPPPPPLIKAAAPPVVRERSFVGSLAGREGAYMLMAYFWTISLAGLVLSAVEGNRDDKKNFWRGEHCGRPLDGNCARLFGYILPVGMSAIFFLLALCLFVFDVSFAVFNMLTTVEEFLHERKSCAAAARKRPTRKKFHNRRMEDRAAAALAVHVAIDLGFILIPTVLLWLSKASLADPLYTLCGQRLQLLWMLGLMSMAVVIFLAAVKSFRYPADAKKCVDAAGVATAFMFCVMLLFTARCYKVSQPVEITPCSEIPEQVTASPKTKAVEPESFDQCSNANIQPPTARPERYDFPPSCDCRVEESETLPTPPVPESVCPEPGRAAPHVKEEDHRLGLPSASGPGPSCDWPRMKQIRPYERKDRCGVGFPQCDWPRAKQIQPYEDRDRCGALTPEHCEWDRAKEVQLYNHEQRCSVEGEGHEQSDWPWLKRVQLYRVQDRCPPKKTQECEWPGPTQIQLYDSSAYSGEACACQPAHDAIGGLDVKSATHALSRRDL